MVDRLADSAMHDAVKSCSDVIESRDEVYIEVAQVAEGVSDFECRGDFARTAESVEVSRVPVLAL